MESDLINTGAKEEWQGTRGLGAEESVLWEAGSYGSSWEVEFLGLLVASVHSWVVVGEGVSW